MLAALAAALVAAAVPAITISAQDPQPKEPSYKYVELLNADSSRFKLGSEKVYILKGNVKMRQGDTLLVADSVEYNEDEKVQTAVATGNLRITDPQNDITGAKGTSYFREKRAVVDGNVKIVTKPKGGQAKTSKDGIKSNWKEPATITCDKLEYLYKGKVAKLSGNLKITQKNRIVTADSALYQVKDELITLSGNVNGRDEKNQTFSSPSDVIVSLKEGDEWIEMKHAVGKFRVEIDEEDQGTAQQQPEKQPAGEATKP